MSCVRITTFQLHQSPNSYALDKCYYLAGVKNIVSTLE